MHALIVRIIALSIMVLFSTTLLADSNNEMNNLIKLANSGDTRAMNILTVRYSNGENGTSQDMKKALKYGKLSAESGDNNGAYNYAILLSRDTKFKNEKESCKWFKRSANLGGKNGAYSAYRAGLCSEDREQSIKYFELAHEKGNVWGSYYLAQLLSTKQRDVKRATQIATALLGNEDTELVKFSKKLLAKLMITPENEFNLTKALEYVDSSHEKYYAQLNDLLHEAKSYLDNELHSKNAAQVIYKIAQEGEVEAVSALAECFGVRLTGDNKLGYGERAATEFENEKPLFIFSVSKFWKHCPSLARHITKEPAQYLMDIFNGLSKSHEFPSLSFNDNQIQYGYLSALSDIQFFIKLYHEELPYHPAALLLVDVERLRIQVESKSEYIAVYADPAIESALRFLKAKPLNQFNSGYASKDTKLRLIEFILAQEFEGVDQKEELHSLLIKEYSQLLSEQGSGGLYAQKVMYHRQQLALLNPSRLPLEQMVFIADQYRTGIGQLKSLSKAKELYKIAVNKGDSYSSAMLGAINESEGNIDSAISYYQQAVNKGYLKASNALARAQASKPKPLKADWEVIRDVMLDDYQVKSAIKEYKKARNYCSEFKRKYMNGWKNTNICKSFDACKSMSESVIDRAETDKNQICDAADDIYASIKYAFDNFELRAFEYAFSDAKNRVNNNAPSFTSAYPYMRVNFNKVGRKMHQDEADENTRRIWAGVSQSIRDLPQNVAADMREAERAFERATGIRSAFSKPKYVADIDDNIRDIKRNISNADLGNKVVEIKRITSGNATQAASSSKKSLNDITNELGGNTGKASELTCTSGQRFDKHDGLCKTLNEYDVDQEIRTARNNSAQCKGRLVYDRYFQECVSENKIRKRLLNQLNNQNLPRNRTANGQPNANNFPQSQAEEKASLGQPKGSSMATLNGELVSISQCIVVDETAYRANCLSGSGKESGKWDLNLHIINKCEETISVRACVNWEGFKKGSTTSGQLKSNQRKRIHACVHGEGYGTDTITRYQPSFTGEIVAWLSKGTPPANACK